MDRREYFSHANIKFQALSNAISVCFPSKYFKFIWLAMISFKFENNVSYSTFFELMEKLGL